MRQFVACTDEPTARRRTFKLLALALGLLSLALVLPASAFISAGDSGWFRQSPWTVGEFTAVAFSDANHGWVVGSTWSEDSPHSAILATVNGGATWKKQKSASFDVYLTAVAFSDAKHGWAVGEDINIGSGHGVILATSNGGVTWSKNNSVSSADLHGVAFTDAKHGWVVGSAGTILATVNGGATWKKQSSGSDNWLQGVAFTDAKHGWAVGIRGTILATTSGGFAVVVTPKTTLQ